MRTALTVDEDWIDAEVTPTFQAREEAHAWPKVVGSSSGISDCKQLLTGQSFLKSLPWKASGVVKLRKVGK
jgi:hypothetical protein